MGVANSTDMNAPYQYAGVSFLDSSTGSAARRLRRTRQRLGAYRHDLLVALRLVNKVDREVLRAEWENWLLDENTRCRRVQRLLTDGAGDPQRVASLRQWQAEYCGSCRQELLALSDGARPSKV
jgi:hypothetical protein